MASTSPCSTSSACSGLCPVIASRHRAPALFRSPPLSVPGSGKRRTSTPWQRTARRRQRFWSGTTTTSTNLRRALPPPLLSVVFPPACIGSCSSTSASTSPTVTPIPPGSAWGRPSTRIPSSTPNSRPPASSSCSPRPSGSWAPTARLESEPRCPARESPCCISRGSFRVSVRHIIERRPHPPLVFCRARYRRHRDQLLRPSDAARGHCCDPAQHTHFEPAILLSADCVPALLRRALHRRRSTPRSPWHPSRFSHHHALVVGRLRTARACLRFCSSSHGAISSGHG